MNPFERKFIEFAQNLSKKNADGHADAIASKSGEVFADKPFTVEYRTLYQISQFGQSVAQIVTFLTTAALGVFALQHVIPTEWGIYIAVPLGFLFAFGVEKVKRSTLQIAAKHHLKYKQIGFVGAAAVLVMLVSIGAALYGAKELPGVVFPKPSKKTDGAAVTALTADIDRVQADIDRIQSNLKTGENWIAENKTLPKLQGQRIALIEKRDQATKDATGRADIDHADALADRAEKIDKMQVYAVGAAIVAELIFLFCTGFILYYLFRHFAETNPEIEADQPGTRAAQTQSANGRPVTYNMRAGQEQARAIIPAPVTHARADDNRTDNTTIIVDGNQRICEHCKTPYVYRHSKQKFCSDTCRIAAWETGTGKTLKRKSKV